MKPLATKGHDTNPNTARPHAIMPLGDSAAYIEFAETLDLAANQAAQNLSVSLREIVPPWVVDVVPALGGVAVHFDVTHRDLPHSPLQEIQRLVSESLTQTDHANLGPSRLIDMPICYDAEYGLDLFDIASEVGLSVEEVIQRHLAVEYPVLMMGFVPGGPYMGGLDPAINLPRRTSPRTKVIQGSVALANLQLVIYPFTTPGGWHIVGRTPTLLFDAKRQPACLLSPRDRVRFVRISTEEFIRLEAEHLVAADHAAKRLAG